MAVKCVECGQKGRAWTREHVHEFNLCQHPVCLYKDECRDTHRRTCPSYCRDVGETPEPHPRDLAEQAARAAQPLQLDLFGELITEGNQ